MNPKDKVVSLDLAKRMKKLGWKFEVERYWVDYKHEDIKILVNEADLYLYPEKHWAIYLAPDAIEIGEKLPDVQICRFGKGDKRYACAYNEGTDNDKRLCDWSLSEALGKMWVYLKEKKLI
jgi:hypothetical protein